MGRSWDSGVLQKEQGTNFFLLNIQCWHLWNAAVDDNESSWWVDCRAGKLGEQQHRSKLCLMRLRWSGIPKMITYVCRVAKPSYEMCWHLLGLWRRQCSRVLSPWKPGRLLLWVLAQSPLLQACVHGLRWFRPAAWFRWGLWTSTQPAVASQPVVMVQIETKPKCLKKANKYWLWWVEVGNLPLRCSVNVKIWTRAEILFLQMSSYQGAWVPSPFE